jgi:hypothetical protein
VWFWYPFPGREPCPFSLISEIRRERSVSAYLFRPFVNGLLIFFSFSDAGGVEFPLYWAHKRGATIDAREGGSTLAIVIIQLWFLHDVCTSCMYKSKTLALACSCHTCETDHRILVTMISDESNERQRTEHTGMRPSLSEKKKGCVRESRTGSGCIEIDS